MFAIAFILLCGASAVTGYWFGFRDAFPLGLMANAAPRGVLAIHHLEELRAGKTERLNMIFEVDVDNGLILSHHVQESPLHDYWERFWGIPDYTAQHGYLTRLADYRKTHPSLMKTEDFTSVLAASEEEGAFRQGLAESGRQSIEIINAMVERYGSKR